jgi:hypothetical protein
MGPAGSWGKGNDEAGFDTGCDYVQIPIRPVPPSSSIL